jgi:tetratricopeptide (TPR) repeat protein
MDINDVKREIAHDKELVLAHTKRLQALEMSIARQGIYAPPHLGVEITELREIVHRLQESIQAKEAAFAKAIELMPLIDQAEYEFNWNEMIRLSEDLLNLDLFNDIAKSKVAFACNRMGIHYHNMKDYDTAIEYKNQSILLEPGNATYHYTRGVSYHGKGNYNSAIADKTMAIKLNGDIPRYFYSRSMSFYGRLDFKRAIADLDRAIKLDETRASYYHQRGVLLHELTQYNKALVDKTKATDLNPLNGYYFYSRGITLLAIGDQPKAQEDFEEALSLGYKPKDRR